MQKEITLQEDDLLVSKTDLKGNITYCNTDFLLYSQFELSEIITKSHNMLRHAAMPKGLFQLMWQALKGQEEFNSFILTQCKDGQSFWSFINVAPTYDAKGNLYGYFSVRRKASYAGIQFYTDIFAQMVSLEKKEKTISQSILNSTDYLTQLLTGLGDSYDANVFKLQFS